MVVLVCGSREWTDAGLLEGVLNGAVRGWGGASLIVQGGARGADTLAFDAAWKMGVPVRSFPADWKRDGKAAGPIRNARMLRESNPDVCIAFSMTRDPATKGTQDMINRCLRAGVPTYLVTPDGTMTQLDREEA